MDRANDASHHGKLEMGAGLRSCVETMPSGVCWAEPTMRSLGGERIKSALGSV
jgi:hypothetical protein